MAPDFWRSEIWHPLTVHFPVALLLVATVAKASALLPTRYSVIISTFAQILLFAGCAGAWLAIYTGDLADGVVARQLCDPTVLKEHEISAFNSAYLFSGAVAVEAYLIYRDRSRKLLNILSLLLMITGSGYLVYAGHDGAALVYQQGAGVYKPDADCN